MTDAVPGGLPRLIWSGLKAALLLPVRPGTAPTGAGPVMLVVLLITALGISGERWLLDADGLEFNWSGLREAWFDLPILLLGSAWLAQSRLAAAPSRIPLLHFAAVVLAASFWIVAFAYALFVADELGWLPERLGDAISQGVYIAAPLWGFVVAIRTIGTMNRFQSIGALRRLAVLGALALTSAWFIVDPVEPYWLAPRAPAPDVYVGSEEILELQPRLLAERLTALQPQRPGETDLYFVGFAPFATEDVFRKELDAIQPLMDRRFDTAGRSVRLVSNPATLRDDPLATAGNLRRTLAAVAARMDPAEDVLVLYLTTHGTPDFRLVAHFPPLALYHIDPAALKAMLDETGIRHRVLIISACYSGGFVEPLRGPDTLIMTASVRDRTSFGCGAESDFTYFGDALFNHGLRETWSFEAAFERALPRILAREQAGGFEPSLPQIDVGDGIRERLRRVEARLAARGATAS
ncbi:MAG: C13 family peptidase [Lautropia sp.]